MGGRLPPITPTNGDPDNECPKSIQASIAGPTKDITQGMWLEVHLDKTTTPARVVLLSFANDIVGALQGLPNLAKLIQCLGDGVTYRAYVVRVEGGRMDVILNRQ